MAYVLKSLKDGGYYYGSTSNLFNRLEAHNRGSVKSTKHRRPLVVHYSEEFELKTEALHREKFFKSPSGNNWLKHKGIIS
ncbi:MAG: GIY-YIG nuclease family protein [bacterium]|nr:GIY-YIG nuclease family protein [bacterium]